MYCGDDFPADPPHPWAIPYGRYSAGEYVPAIIFPEEDCGEGGRGVWTWCPCTDGEGSYPGLQDCVRVIGGQDVEPRSVFGEYTIGEDFEGTPTYTNDNGWVLWFVVPEDTPDVEWWISRASGDAAGTAWNQQPLDQTCPFGDYEPINGAKSGIEVVPCCPDDGTNCDDNATGEGNWVFRCGCEELGPPPVVGRFYGETIMTGFCCEESSSFSVSSFSLSSIESLSSCSMPQFPVFWWDLVLQENPPWNQVLDRPNDECGVSGNCSAWLWCQCEEDMSSACEVEWGESACPFTPEGTDAEDGYWMPYGGDDHHGPPCVIGRFYGEVVWFCQCPTSSSSSLSSCGCDDGGYMVVCDGCNEDVAGIFNFVGYHGGMPYYEQCGGPWVLYWEDNGDDSGTWYFSKEGLGGVPSSGYGGSGTTMDLPTDSDINFNPISPSTGYPTIDCCYECNCGPCNSTIDVEISGLSGYCAQANDTYTLTKYSGDGECYYYDEIFPGNCDEDYDHIWIKIVCECNLWWMEVSAEVCDNPPGHSMHFNNWISDPEIGDCPPNTTWNMHIVTEDCDPGGQIPTVTTSDTPP